MPMHCHRIDRPASNLVSGRSRNAGIKRHSQRSVMRLLPAHGCHESKRHIQQRRPRLRRLAGISVPLADIDGSRSLCSRARLSSSQNSQTRSAGETIYQIHYCPSNANAAPHMVLRFDVVGADFVEVSPPYDPSSIMSLLPARTSLDFIGSAFHERAKRRGQS